MPFIRVRDIDICYEIYGAGPRLLVLNRTAGDLRRRPKVADIPLVERFEVLSYDQRGLGRTDKPDGPYSMAGYAADAAGLLDALGWERCPVVGISFGGMVGQELALRCPEKVERLVIVGTTGGGKSGVDTFPVHDFWTSFAAASPREKARLLIPRLDVRHDAAWQAANPERTRRLVDAIEATYQIGLDEPGHMEGMLRQVAVRLTHDTYDRLPALKLPVFICAGKYDGVAPPEFVEKMHQQIPGSKMEIFEGGHQFLNEDPAAWQRIEQFLNGQLDD